MVAQSYLPLEVSGLDNLTRKLRERRQLWRKVSIYQLARTMTFASTA